MNTFNNNPDVVLHVAGLKRSDEVARAARRRRIRPVPVSPSGHARASWTARIPILRSLRHV